MGYTKAIDVLPLEIIEQIQKYISGTVLYIPIVLKAGEIVEVGSHKELLIKNGMYADMFRAQSEWYRMNT